MKKILLLTLLAFPVTLVAQLTARPAGTAGAVGFYEFLPPGYNQAGSYNYPLIINLHGAGEVGEGTAGELPLVLTWGLGKLLREGATMTFTVQGQQHSFIALSPQLSNDYFNWQNFYIDSMINYAIRNLKVDVNKIFITGYSLGGGGAWKYATSSVDTASRIAGIIPVAPSPDYTNFCTIAQARVAVWAHHALNDSAIPVKYTDSAITAINNCSPAIPALSTIYQTGAHGDPWDWAYDTLHNYQYPNMFEWMIGTSRLNTAANNQGPVASAGNDITINVPANQTVLNGSASVDPNDVIVKYLWTKVSGPNEFNIERPAFPVTNLTGLVQGNYSFMLTVTDEFGVVSTDLVNVLVTVQAPLPLEITYFKGLSNGNVNVLTWQTTNEVNTLHFEIFRSNDGHQFVPIGTIVNGGNSYSFTDDKAPGGISYYRLKQVDRDGKWKWSDIIMIKNSNALVLLKTFPNPVKDVLSLIIEGELLGSLEISILDAQGRLVLKQWVDKGQVSWKGTLNLSNLHKGVYTIQIKSNSANKITRSFVRQ